VGRRLNYLIRCQNFKVASWDSLAHPTWRILYSRAPSVSTVFLRKNIVVRGTGNFRSGLSGFTTMQPTQPSAESATTTPTSPLAQRKVSGVKGSYLLRTFPSLSDLPSRSYSKLFRSSSYHHASFHQRRRSLPEACL
jgi:hypothetical protein